MTAIELALAFIDRLPALYKLAESAGYIGGLIFQHRELQERLQAENRGPTDAEWQALNARLDDLEKKLQA